MPQLLYFHYQSLTLSDWWKKTSIWWNKWRLQLTWIQQFLKIYWVTVYYQQKLLNSKSIISQIHTIKDVEQFQRFEWSFASLPCHIELSSQFISKHELHISSNKVSQIAASVFNEYLYLNNQWMKKQIKAVRTILTRDLVIFIYKPIVSYIGPCSSPDAGWHRDSIFSG